MCHSRPCKGLDTLTEHIIGDAAVSRSECDPAIQARSFQAIHPTAFSVPLQQAVLRSPVPRNFPGVNGDSVRISPAAQPQLHRSNRTVPLTYFVQQLWGFSGIRTNGTVEDFAATSGC